MTLQDFGKMTINVIREDGVAGYLPTIVLTDTQQIQAIEGIPADVDHRDAIQNVISRSALGTREFFFGVQSGPQQLTIGHSRPGQPTEFMSITKTASGYVADRLSTCEWWRL